MRRFTDDDFNFDLSIKDLILSPQYRHGTLNEDEENYDSDNNPRSIKYLPGRYIKPTTLREVSKGFELLQQYKIYKQYENIKCHLPDNIDISKLYSPNDDDFSTESNNLSLVLFFTCLL